MKSLLYILNIYAYLATDYEQQKKSDCSSHVLFYTIYLVRNNDIS